MANITWEEVLGMGNMLYLYKEDENWLEILELEKTCQIKKEK